MTSHAMRAQHALPGNLSAIAHRATIVALLARRAVWMTALVRVAPQAPATTALAADEIALLDRLARSDTSTATLACAIERLAAIGGSSQATPRFARPFAVARGLSRMADLQIARRLRAAKFLDRG